MKTKSVDRFNSLDGKTVTREYLKRIVRLAEKEKQVGILRRIYTLLDANPDALEFAIVIKEKATPEKASFLSGTKENKAVSSNGKLNKGYRYEKGGKIVSVTDKAKSKAQKLKKALDTHSPYKDVPISVYNDWKREYAALTAKIQVEPYLYGLEAEEVEPNEPGGLSKPVTPNDIYQMITDKVVSLLESPVKWQQEWGGANENGYLIAYNFKTKKPYRGINAFLLGSKRMYDPDAPLLKNPYYLTFNQIEEFKGTLKKGSASEKVIYFTTLYTYSQEEPEKLEFGTYDLKKFVKWTIENLSKIASLSDVLKDGTISREEIAIQFAEYCKIPVLKYYNVYNGADVEGINFNLKNFKGAGKVKKIKSGKVEKIDVAEAIIKSYPDPAPKIRFGGTRAFFRPTQDLVQMPLIEQFKYVQAYYTTFFHELIHSTGSTSRLDRVKGKRFGDKAYSFEELIAELGASFLSAEAGILHYTIRNSAAYIKSWRKVLLKHMKDDNKFFFRAASQAQKAVDFMLDRDSNEIPKYSQVLKGKEISKKAKQTAPVSLGTIVLDMHPIEARPIDELPPASKGEAPAAVYLPEPEIPTETLPEGFTEKPSTQRPAPESNLVMGLRDAKKEAKNATYFKLSGPMAEFLGRIEKKPKHSVVITLDAPPGSGKTRSVFQALDMFANAGLYSLFASLEEHPQSSLFTSKADQYIKPNNEQLVDTIGDLPETYDEFLKLMNQYDVIAVDSWNKVYEKYRGIDFDNDLRKAMDGKIIIAIFQRTQDGKMRGGSNAAFDGDIIVQVVAKPSFKDSYLQARKNRYQSIPLDEIGYNFYHKAVINPKIENMPVESGVLEIG